MGGCFCLRAMYGCLTCGSLRLRGSLLRGVLHLYNALRCLDLVGAVDFLDWVDKIFSKAPSVWFAGKGTTRGVFTKNYLLGTGIAIRDASVIVTTLKHENGVSINPYRFCDDREKDLSFRSPMEFMMRIHHYRQGFRAVVSKSYTGYDARNTNGDSVNGTLD